MFQNTCESTDRSLVAESRYHKRLQLILRALLAISGEALRKTFMSQQLLIKVRQLFIVQKFRYSFCTMRANIFLKFVRLVYLLPIE